LFSKFLFSVNFIPLRFQFFEINLGVIVHRNRICLAFLFAYVTHESNVDNHGYDGVDEKQLQINKFL